MKFDLIAFIVIDEQKNRKIEERKFRRTKAQIIRRTEG